jgi:hypothetical protein
MCWSAGFDSFATVGPRHSALLDGAVRYCFSSGPQSGRLRVRATGAGASLQMTLELDAAGGMASVERGGETVLCELDASRARASCRGN